MWTDLPELSDSTSRKCTQHFVSSQTENAVAIALQSVLPRLFALPPTFPYSTACHHAQLACLRFPAL